MNRRNILGMMAGTLGTASAANAARQQTGLNSGQRLARAAAAAADVRRAFSKRGLRNRLASVGVQGEWLDGELESLGLHGSGVRLKLGGSRQLLTGPGIDLRLRMAFPELSEQMSPVLGISAPATSPKAFSVLSTHDAPPTNIPPTTPISNPDDHAVSTLYYDLSGVSGSWSISSVVHHLWVDNTGDPNNPNDGDIYNLLVTDPYGQTNFGTGTVYRGTGRWDSITWPAGGMSWVLSNAGSSSVSPGTLNVNISKPGTLFWIVTVYFAYLRITY